MVKSKSHSLIHFSWKTVIGLVLVGAFLYIVLPHIGELHTSVKLLEHVRAGWLASACLASLATYLSAAGIYVVLAKHRLRYFPTLLVQGASMFANRLLPGGVGALGVNFEYLRKNHHSVSEAVSVLAVDDLCGLVGHIMVLVTVLITVPFHLAPLSIPHTSTYVYWAGAAVIIVAAVVLVWSRKLRDELFRTILGVLKNIGRYRAHPLRLVWAIGISMSLTLLYSLCLAACGHALNVHLAFGQFFLVMTVGVFAGTVTPTPGGLLGAEAGLLAGLVAYGVPAAPALAVVLAYRLLTYWLAFLLGAVAFFLSERLRFL
jgi:undecaprenyl-diphosphatase